MNDTEKLAKVLELVGEHQAMHLQMSRDYLAKGKREFSLQESYRFDALGRLLDDIYEMLEGES